MNLGTVPTGAALTVLNSGIGRVYAIQVTTAGTGSGQVTINDGYKATDLAIDATNPNKVTSSSHSFTSKDVNLPLQITAGTGFTVQTTTIVSVSGGAAFLAAPAGTTSSSSGTYSVGTGNIVYQIPATVSVDTAYAINPVGAPYVTQLNATNVSSGPVFNVVFDATSEVSQ